MNKLITLHLDNSESIKFIEISDNSIHDDIQDLSKMLSGTDLKIIDSDSKVICIRPSKVSAISVEPVQTTSKQELLLEIPSAAKIKKPKEKTNIIIDSKLNIVEDVICDE